jgi:sugar phosphate isomerase/epimerase
MDHGSRPRVGLSAEKRAHDLSDFGAELDAIEALGVDSIEIPLYDCDVVVGGRIRRPQLDALKRACAGRACGYSVHGPLGINFMTDAWRLPRHFEVLLASLEAAAELGAGNYVLHSGMAPTQQGDGLEDAYARQRDYLWRAGEAARPLGLHVCVETLFGGFDGALVVPTPARLARELATVGHPHVAATIDVSHAYLRLDWLGARDSLVEEIQALAPFGRHLHLHDSFGRQDDAWMYTSGERLAFGHGDLHLPVGWGDIPWRRLMETCAFPPGALFNIELEQRYWYAAPACVEATRDLAALAALRQGRSRPA